MTHKTMVKAVVVSRDDAFHSKPSSLGDMLLEAYYGGLKDGVKLAEQRVAKEIYSRCRGRCTARIRRYLEEEYGIEIKKEEGI